MHKKALTVAIAGALAAPMAAQAVDFTISGHVNRALFISDSDSSTTSSVKDNGSSGTRIRATGSSELMEGTSAGVNLEYGAGSTLSLRYGEVWYSGDFGKVSVGQGDQGGEGSVYNDKSGVFGIGHGQDHNGAATGYYTSLDGGAGRNERIRYDTPSVGPISAAVSVGNGDQISAGLKLSQEFGGTAFSAGLGFVQNHGAMLGQSDTLSGSAGVKMPSGVTISAAFGTGKNHEGAAAVATIPAHFRWVDITTPVALDSDANMDGKETATFDVHMANLRARTHAGAAKGADADTMADGELAKKLKAELFDMLDGADDMGCNPAADPGVAMPGGMPNTGATAMCGQRQYPATPGSPMQITAPSFFQTTIGYVFGDTSFGVSWYQASDMNRDGSRLTAIGVGVNHNLPKAGAQVYAAAQNYQIEDGATDSDSTVVMIGTRIKF